jgi:two-component system cell cycle sensor histidine kinase/response regulator CckA
MAPSKKPASALPPEQLFRSLYQHMNEGVALHEVILDGAGTPVNYRILDVNPQYEHFTGLAPERVLGKLATDAYGTPVPPYLEEFTSVGMGKPPRRFETHFAPHDRHYEISVAPMGVGFFATIFTDISERKRQERAIAAKSEELDRFFRLAVDLLCIASTDGRFLRVNSSWADVLGWSVEELEGRPFLDFVHPDDLPATRSALAQLEAGKPAIHFTSRYRAHDGSYRFIEWRSVPAPDGRIYAAARDVTQRIRHEQAMQAAEERLRRIFALLPNPMTLTKLDGTIIDCNEAFQELSGYTRDDLVGRATFDLAAWGTAEQRQSMRESLLSTGEFHGLEIDLHRKDGRKRLLLLAGRRFDIGEEANLIFAGQDITEKRAMEQQMLHTQKLESLGVLAGGIAHDFNNLLTGILGNADLALAELSPMAPARECLDDIGVAARRASELCRQLLAYSGKGRFVVQPVDLAELVREMGHLLAVSISKKAALQYHFADGLSAIEADATQLRQVVMNLIVNASEAIGDRAGVIAVRTGLAACDESYLRGCFCAHGIQPGDFVYLEVSDTGQGMERATLERIFDPFFTTKFTGRGLGLAAVLGIVRGHRGAIRVYSEPGHGTTFKLLFPTSRSTARPAIAPAATLAPWTGEGIILLVDDEEVVRRIGRRMLERVGFTVLTAMDGRDAVAQFERDRDRIRLVVLDLTMPQLDGEACFRALRQLKPDVKVLLTSGFNEQEAINAFAGKGLAGFVQKPFTSEELLAKVRSIL